MRTGERRKYETSGVRLSWRDGHLSASLIHLLDCPDILKIKLWIYAMGEHIIGKCQDIHITGSLTVSKQGTLNSLGPGKHCKLCGCNALPAVIMRVYGKRNIFPVIQVIGHVFNLIRIDIGCVHFHCRRQIDDHLSSRSALPGIQHRIADFCRIVHFRTGKGLRRILKADLAREFLGIFFNKRCSCQRNIDNLFLALMEYHISLQHRCGIIDMYNCLRKSRETLKGPLQLLGTALYKHLHRHIRRNQLSLDQLAQEVILDLAGCRETNFDFLKTKLHQHVKELNLFIDSHRVHKCLVTISQIYRAPDWCLGNLIVNPCSFRIVKRRKSSIPLVI